MVARFIFLVLLTIWSVPSQSAQRLYSWKPPTTRVDGKPITVSEIDHFNLYCATSPIGPWKLMWTAPGIATSAFVPDCIDTGTGYYAATAVDSNLRESEKSNVVVLTVDPVLAPKLCTTYFTKRAQFLSEYSGLPEGWYYTMSYCYP